MEHRTPDAFTITASEDGPLLISGEVVLRRMTITPQGRHYVYVDEGEVEHGDEFSLCRCGHSESPPFCSGAHAAVGFDGTEAAPREPFEQRAKRIENGNLVLLDDYDLCALARFCHTDKGAIWAMMRDPSDPDVRAEILRAADECPAGRLVVIDTDTGETLESAYPNEIIALKDPQRHCDGPLWVRGNFTFIGVDGPYGKRSKCTLCRCGLSAIKPLCDSEHAFAHWTEPPMESPASGGRLEEHPAA